MFCAKSCANIGSSNDDLCSARSTVAIKLSIRLPVNVISNIPVFLPGCGLVLFFLGRSGKTPPQSFLKSLPGTPYYHRTGRPAVSPGQTELIRTQTFSAARIFAQIGRAH